MERRMGIIAILVGAFWIVSFIAALILGLMFISSIEDIVLAPVDALRALDVFDLFEGPLLEFKAFFTKMKLVYAGVTTWLALPQILLIYTGWRLRKRASRGLRRKRTATSR